MSSFVFILLNNTYLFLFQVRRIFFKQNECISGNDRSTTCDEDSGQSKKGKIAYTINQVYDIIYSLLCGKPQFCVWQEFKGVHCKLSKEIWARIKNSYAQHNYTYPNKVTSLNSVPRLSFDVTGW